METCPRVRQRGAWGLVDAGAEPVFAFLGNRDMSESCTTVSVTSIFTVQGTALHVCDPCDSSLHGARNNSIGKKNIAQVPISIFQLQCFTNCFF